MGALVALSYPIFSLRGSNEAREGLTFVVQTDDRGSTSTTYSREGVEAPGAGHRTGGGVAYRLILPAARASVGGTSSRGHRDTAARWRWRWWRGGAAAAEVREREREAAEEEKKKERSWEGLGIYISLEN
jgi:hypothetical protein